MEGGCNLSNLPQDLGSSSLSSDVWMVSAHDASARSCGFLPPTLFERAGVKPLTDQIALRQIMLLGRVGRAPADGALRRNTFAGDSASPQIGRYVRRVGRPRHDWTSQTMQRARVQFTTGSEFEKALLDRTRVSTQRWKHTFA